MLTIDAATHPLLREYHRPNDKKRMIVVLPEESYAAWLDAPPERSMEFMRQYPADRLLATLASVPKTPKRQDANIFDHKYEPARTDDCSLVHPALNI